MPGTAALADAARDAVHDRHQGAVVELSGHLVPESAATAELLDIGTAQATRTHVDERAGAGRLGHIGELGSPSASSTTARTAVS